MPPVPRVIVFDLDGTLWSPEMYQLWGGGAPFKASDRAGQLKDRSGAAVNLMGESLELLRSFATDPRWSGVYLALASTCDEPEWARECLEKFAIPTARGATVTMGSLFHFHEIYHASSKATHFQRILEKANAHARERGSGRGASSAPIGFADMVFYDNQRDNVADVSPLGVHCVYTPRGMEAGAFARGLEGWAAARGVSRRDSADM